MVGDGHAYFDTGYSVLEEGDINPRSLCLEVRRFLIVDPDGETIGVAKTLIEAEQFLERHIGK